MANTTTTIAPAINGSALSDGATDVIIILGVVIGAIWAAKYYLETMNMSTKIVQSEYNDRQSEPILDSKSNESHEEDPQVIQRQLDTVSAAIQEGAQGFLRAEYQYLSIFTVGMSVLLVIFLGARDVENSWVHAIFSMIAFVVGGVTSILCGYLGMYIAVRANVRVTVTAYNNKGVYTDPFNASFKGGAVMGFSLCALAIGVLYILVSIYKLYFDPQSPEDCRIMYECVAGYGFGGSAIALFGRVGGGIYTKAADVGADIFKLDGLKEDDPRNPAVIADNVGDNVGDIAGMGADLFGSFAESSSAAMLISASSPDLWNSWSAMCFPMLIGSVGVVVCLITSLFATSCCLVHKRSDVEASLKRQLLISTFLMSFGALAISWVAFPSEFAVSTKVGVKNWHIFFCVEMGLLSGLIIGLMTEYYTSNAHGPTIEVAVKSSGQGGAPTNIIYGLALGYKSVIIPVYCLAATVYVTYSLAAMYGVACGAIGILSTLAIGLTIDAYGPICDNAGGIAEMSEMPEAVRDVTDALDAAGNTTAAIGKGFAIGSAAMVGLALFGAFVSTFQEVGTTALPVVDILDPWVFAGLLVGAMLPYWFSAMTMKSVGEAAHDMAEEVARQFRDLHLLEDSSATPEYEKCVEISTKASLKEMIAPGALVLLSPLITGYVFNVKCLAGLLVGGLTSGVQMAISASNSGGAWDNAKKFVEQKKDDNGQSYKSTPWHAACVVGDTVGDPMKDTSGPSLNILIKLMAITSVVFAPSMATKFDDGGIIQKYIFGQK
jgi:inorganic pyrophosphatase